MPRISNGRTLDPNDVTRRSSERYHRPSEKPNDIEQPKSTESILAIFRVNLVNPRIKAGTARTPKIVADASSAHVVNKDMLSNRMP